MKKNKHPTINKTLFSDAQIETICERLSMFFDALPFIVLTLIGAIVVIVAIIWGDLK